MAAHSKQPNSCLENPWTKEPGRLQSMGSQRVRHDEQLSLLFLYSLTASGILFLCEFEFVFDKS